MTDRRKRGSNELLHRRALPASRVEHVADALGVAARETEPAPIPLEGELSRLYAELNRQGRHADSLASALGWSPARLSRHLLTLQLRGLAAVLPGNRHARTR